MATFNFYCLVCFKFAIPLTRFARGLKTLQDLLKQAKAGKTIKDEDIPPPVAVGKPADAPQAPPSAPPAPAPEPEPEQPLIDLGSPEPEPEPSPPEPKEPPPPPPTESLSEEKQQGLQMILSKLVFGTTNSNKFILNLVQML